MKTEKEVTEILQSLETIYEVIKVMDAPEYEDVFRGGVNLLRVILELPPYEEKKHEWLRKI